MGEIWRFSKYYFKQSTCGEDAGNYSCNRNAEVYFSLTGARPDRMDAGLGIDCLYWKAGNRPA